MGWDRIMDQALDTVFAKVLLQFVTVDVANDEEMPYMAKG